MPHICFVEHDTPFVTLYRRTKQGFIHEVYRHREAVIDLPDLETELPLSEIYEDVEFRPETE